jgi:flagellar motor component MotA
MKILFALVGLGLIGAAVVLGGSPAIFFNAPSLLIVVGLTLCVPLANHSIMDAFNAFRTAFSSGDVDRNEGQRHVTVLQTFRMAATGSGIVGTFIGLVQMLQSMDELKNIGPAMAVALLTILYAVFLSELVIGPLSNRIHARMTASSESPAKPETSNNVLNVSAVLCGLFGFTIVIVSMLQASA